MAEAQRERQPRHLQADTPQTLDELAAIANREHALSELAAQTALQHAIKAGEALIAARDQCPAGDWSRWLDQNFTASQTTAFGYIRVATHKDAIPEGTTAVKSALELLAGQPQARGPHGPSREKPIQAAEARRMAAESGLSSQEIARKLGVGAGTAWRWVNPQKAAANQRAYEKRQRDARAALRVLEREKEVRRAVRKAGAALAEAYSMGARMGKVLEQAEQEATTDEAREALREATAHYHKMSDAIVRALGVSS